MPAWTDETLRELVTPDDLAGFIRSSAGDTDLLEGARDSAAAELAAVLVDAWREVPESVARRLMLEVGAEFIKRGDSPTGGGQFATMDGGVQVRGPRDPLARQWPILRRYVVEL